MYFFLLDDDNDDDDDSDGDDTNTNNKGHVCGYCGKEYLVKKQFLVHFNMCKSVNEKRNTIIHEASNQRSVLDIATENVVSQTSNNKINNNALNITSSSSFQQDIGHTNSNKQSTTIISNTSSTTAPPTKMVPRRIEATSSQTAPSTVMVPRRIEATSSQTAPQSKNSTSNNMPLLPYESQYVNIDGGTNSTQSSYFVTLLVRRLSNDSGNKYNWFMNNNKMSLKIQDGGLIIRETESLTLIADFPGVCIEKLVVMTDRIVRIMITVTNDCNNAVAIQFPSSTDQTSFMSFIQTNTDINCYIIDSFINSNDNFNNDNTIISNNSIDYVRHHFINPTTSPSPYGISLVDLNDKSVQAYILLLLMSEEFNDFTINLENIIEKNKFRLPSKHKK